LTFVVQISDASTLSWETRLKGFVICFAIGCIASLLVNSQLVTHAHLLH